MGRTLQMQQDFTAFGVICDHWEQLIPVSLKCQRVCDSVKFEDNIVCGQRL